MFYALIVSVASWSACGITAMRLAKAEKSLGNLVGFFVWGPVVLYTVVMDRRRPNRGYPYYE